MKILSVFFAFSLVACTKGATLQFNPVDITGYNASAAFTPTPGVNMTFVVGAHSTVSFEYPAGELINFVAAGSNGEADTRSGANNRKSYSYGTAGTYTITAEDNLCTTLIINSPQLTGISGLNNLTSLTSLSIIGTGLSSIDVDSLPASLQSLYLPSNQLTAFTGTSLPAGLTYLDLNNNQLANFVVGMPNTLTHLYLGGNQLTSTTLDSVVSSMVSRTAGQIDLRQATPTLLSPAGKANKAILLAQGVDLRTDVDRLGMIFETTAANEIVTITLSGGLSSIQNGLGTTIPNMTSSFTITYPTAGIYYVSALDNTGAPKCTNLQVTGTTNAKLMAIEGINFLPNLINLELSNNSVKYFDGTSLPSSLSTFRLNNNQLTSFDARTLPTSLTLLDLGSNLISDFSSASLPSSLVIIYLYQNEIGVTDVNRILVDLDTQGRSSETTLFINQTTPTAPTGDGLASLNRLIANLANIVTD